MFGLKYAKEIISPAADEWLADASTQEPDDRVRDRVHQLVADQSAEEDT